MQLPGFLRSARHLLGGKRVHHPEKTALLVEKMPVAPESLPAAVVQRYAVRRALGQGAFGIVFLAEDRRIGRLVAIKQLLKTHVTDPEIHARFMQEARIGSQIDHPNIVDVFALEEDDKSSCIIMEYLGGGSLNSFILKEKVVELATATRIALGVLSGLEAAHQVMVVHRDIKPQNILFGPQGEPKITDFGMAHLPIQGGGARNLDEGEGKVLGTPLYMAPEQFLRQPVDARVDLYSLGVIFHEMLTGRKLFRIMPGMTLYDIGGIIVDTAPDLTGLDREDLPSELKAVIARLLSKDRRDRFASARETAMAIEAAVPPTITTSLRGPGGDQLRIGDYGPLLSSPAAMLEDVIRLLLVDGLLSPAERRELDRRAERLGINQLQAQAIEEKVRHELSLPSIRAIKEYNAILEAFYSSSETPELNPQQRLYLEGKRDELKIPPAECERLEARVRDRVVYQRRISEETLMGIEKMPRNSPGVPGVPGIPGVPGGAQSCAPGVPGPPGAP